MAFVPNVLLSFLLGVIPLIIAAVLAPILCQGAVLSLPSPFLTTHFFLSLFTRSFLDLAASVWLFLPLFPLLTITPVFFTAYLWSILWFFLSNALQSITSSMNLIGELTRNVNIKKQVYDSMEKVFDSVERFLDSTNFTEMFQNVNPPPGASWGAFRPDNIYSNYNISEAIRNLTVSESTQQYIDTINVAIIGLLDHIEISNFVNTTLMPAHLHAAFDRASETIRDLAPHLNFTEILREGKIQPDVQESIRAVGDALENLGQHINATELLEAVAPNAKKEALKSSLNVTLLLTDPATAFQLFQGHMRSTSLGEAVQDLFAILPTNFHIVASAYFFLLVVSIPGLFILRAALQDGFLWLITRRYASNVPSEQRSVSGWMFVSATSGLVSAAAEAFPYCFFYFCLYNSNLLSSVSVFVFVLHSLTAIPLRASSHMRIAEASARRDVLKDSKPRFLSGFLVSALTNGIFNLWWLCISGVLMISLITFWLPGFFLVTDAVAVGIAVYWGRGICQRLLRDEKRMIEDRERKRD